MHRSLYNKKHVNFFLEAQDHDSYQCMLTEQHKIYTREINLFLKSNKILSTEEAITILSKKNASSFNEKDLERLVDEGKVFFVTLPSKYLFRGYPAFQFDILKHQIKPLIKIALNKLRPYYFDWDLAFWFNSYIVSANSSFIESIDLPEREALLLGALELEARKDY